MEFRIDITVDPKSAEANTARVEKSLEKLENAADKLRLAIAQAVNMSGQNTGTRLTLERIAQTLERTEQLARITDARISQIGKNIDGRGLKKVKDGLDDASNSAGKLGIILRRLFFGLSAGILIRELVQMVDAFTNVQNRLKLVTEGQENLKDTTQELFDISNRTRASFQGTSELYTRLALSAKELGRSQQELLQFTESLNQAVILSGASAQEASNGIIQLSQGLASGTLRGDELRSVLEQLPAVADVIAKGLGVTRGQLRKMGEEGRITAEVVLDAFKKARTELNENFAKTVPTIGQSFVVLRNNLIEFIGALDQATGSSAAFSQAILFIANNLQFFAILLGVVGTAITVNIVKQFPILVAGFAKVRAAFIAAFPVAIIAAAAAGIAELISFQTRLKEEIEEANKNRGQDQTLTFVSQQRAAIISLQKEIDQLSKVRERDGTITKVAATQIENLRGRIVNHEAAIRKVTDAEKKRGDQVALNNAKTKEAFDSLSKEAELLKLGSREREVQTRLLKEVQTLQKANVNVTPEIRQRLENQIREVQALELQAEVLDDIKGPEEERNARIQALNALLAQGRINQEEFTKQLAKEKDIEGPKIPGLPTGEGLESLQEKLRAIREQFAASGQGADIFGNAAAQAILKATAAAPNLVARIEAITKLFNDGVISADEYKLAVDKALGPSPSEELAMQVREVNLQFENGKLTVDEYNRRLDELALRGLESSTALEDGFARAFIRIKQEAEDLAAVGEKVVNVFADRATDALVKFAETGQFSFKEFASAILSDLTRIIARLLIIQALNAAFGGGGAAAAGAAQAGSSSIEARASGGPVQAGRSYLVGEDGPELFRPNQSGAIVPNNQVAAAQAAPVVQVINVQDPNEIPANLDSGRSDQSIINVLARNPQKVNRVLGNS